jgi:hypothetical protein
MPETSTIASWCSPPNARNACVYLLAPLFDSHPGAKHITLSDNSIHDNNRVNDATPGTLLAGLPSGTGILLFGVDDALITKNRIVNNDLTGIAVVDACLAFAGTGFDCSVDPTVTPEYPADQDATNNQITHNVLIDNGTNPSPGAFALAASDLGLLSTGAGNCYSKNVFGTSFSILGALPPCP